ncbi:uncharacterized protein [Miscanthus floridulus]|uniref:uncharacterized protein isoform X2 n=1 Tax=Miscanthus floridulus TaxID=154761 RepID=UPI0034576425
MRRVALLLLLVCAVARAAAVVTDAKRMEPWSLAPLSSSERQLRGWPAQVGAGERNGGVGRQRHPALGDLRLRGVHRVGAQAGRHAAGGAAGRARGAPRQRGLHPAAPGRDARRLLRHHLQRGADVRAGGDAQRVGEPRVGGAPHADHLRQQRLGLVRLGLQGQVRRRDARHPQPRRGGGPRLRPAHRRRRHPGAVPAHAGQGQHAQERRLRGGPLLPAQRVVGRARAAQHRGRPLAAARLDDRLLQGRQVRGRRALRRAPGRARRRAGGRQGERAGPGGAHRAGVDLPPRLRRGGLRRRMHGIHGRRGLRGARHRQGAVRVQGHRWVQARRARLHGHRQPHPRRLPEHLLPHEGRRRALRPARR